MKRDLDLIRKMVLAIEDAESGWAPKFSFEGYTPSQVGYHAYLLLDAGLAKGLDEKIHGSQAPAALGRSRVCPGSTRRYSVEEDMGDRHGKGWRDHLRRPEAAFGNSDEGNI